MNLFAQGGSHRPGLFTARHYRWLALIYAAVTLFASLVPLDYVHVPLHQAILRFQEVCAEPIRFRLSSDFVANVLLFIPFGYLLTAAFAVDRPLISPFVAVGAVAVCALFSAAIEFAQLFFPPRVSSLNDVVAETVGGAIGALFWLIVGQQLTKFVRRDDFGFAGGAFPIELLPCCIVVLTVVQLLPLDLTLQPGALYHKYKEGRVRLFSFNPGQGTGYMARRELRNLFLFLPIGVLLSGLGKRHWWEWSGWRWAFGVGLLLAGLIRFVQLFELQSSSVASDVLTNGLAVLLGWVLGVAVRSSSPSTRRTRTFGLEPEQRRDYFRAALILWCAGVAFYNWHPFDFSFDLGWAGRRLMALSFIPFVDYWGGHYFQALNQLVTRVAFFLPVGLLLPPALGWETSETSTGIRVVLLVALWAILIEIGQAFLPERFPSVTDVLVESIGAWFGYLCAKRLRARGGTRGFGEAASGG